MDATHFQEADRVRSRDHPCGTWVGLLTVLILAALPLLAASAFSAPVAQTLHPVSYLPLVKGPPYYPIAFTSGRDMDPNEYFMRTEIYVMNADGSSQTRLTYNYNPSQAYTPVWSPDGRQIAFGVSLDGDPEIYVMNADGSNQTNLTTNPGYDAYPVWSPDGHRIVFVSDRDGNGEIYVMNADGSSQTNLTNNPASDGGPVWSPTIN
jgi:Tol biopolymer transport system component